MAFLLGIKEKILIVRQETKIKAENYAKLSAYSDLSGHSLDDITNAALEKFFTADREFRDTWDKDEALQKKHTQIAEDKASGKVTSSKGSKGSSKGPKVSSVAVASDETPSNSADAKRRGAAVV